MAKTYYSCSITHEQIQKAGLYVNRRITLVAFLEKFRKYSEHPLERLTEIGLREKMAFLDVGCLLGFYSFSASSIVGEKGLVYALDKNPDCIAHVENKIKRQGTHNVKTITASAEQTSLPAESVDMVFLHLVLHDIPDKQTAMQEFNRVLKTNGKLVIDEDRTMPPNLIRKLAEEHGFQYSTCLRKTTQIFEKTQTIHSL